MRRAIIPNNSNLVIKGLALAFSYVFQFCAKIHANSGKLNLQMIRIGSASSKNPMRSTNIKSVANHFI